MSAATLLRTAGAVDITSGVVALTAAGWIGDQVGVSATIVRLAAALLVVVGVDTIWFADRAWMAKATIGIEAVAGLVALDLVLLGDPTRLGTALLLATAVCCAAVAVEAALLGRSTRRSLVTA